jgi:2,3-bisphosphoglycerate-dependent phosphoglycerate mutase
MTIAKRVILVAAFLFSAGAAVEASPILFLVRHAEKATTGGNDPELSSAGRERATALAQILKDSEITAIFTTEFKRTQETAAPTANATRITPTIIPANDVAALVQKLRSLKGNALVVGHGNTIPDLVKALGIATAVNISEDDYSELFVVILGDNPQLLRLHYPK